MFFEESPLLIGFVSFGDIFTDTPYGGNGSQLGEGDGPIVLPPITLGSSMPPPIVPAGSSPDETERWLERHGVIFGRGLFDVEPDANGTFAGVPQATPTIDQSNTQIVMDELWHLWEKDVNGNYTPETVNQISQLSEALTDAGVDLSCRGQSLVELQVLYQNSVGPHADVFQFANFIAERVSCTVTVGGDDKTANDSSRK